MSMQERKHDSASGCLIHLFWLIIGNIVLLIVAGRLFLQGWTFALLDVLYWTIVALILAARFVDIRYFHGSTTDDKPATLADWRRYALIFILMAAILWLSVHFLGAFMQTDNQGVALALELVRGVVYVQ